MTAPDHWQSLPREKRLEMEKHARGLVRGSIIEDAASRFMAMCMAEAIGESKRRADPSAPTQDERVKEALQDMIALFSADNALLEGTHLNATLELARAALRDLEQP